MKKINLMLTGIAVAFLFTSGSAQAGPNGLLARNGAGPGISAQAQVEEEPEQEPEKSRFSGALDIRIQSEEDRLNPPAELVLTGPSGAKTGYDPRTGSTYQEIPGSSYEWETTQEGRGPREVIIHVARAAGGLYGLRLIATRTGKYRLWIRGYGGEDDIADVRFTDAKILKDTVQHYLINFTPAGPRLDVRRTRIKE